jgi:hypothetical protein
MVQGDRHGTVLYDSSPSISAYSKTSTMECSTPLNGRQRGCSQPNSMATHKVVIKEIAPLFPLSLKAHISTCCRRRRRRPGVPLLCRPETRPTQPFPSIFTMSLPSSNETTSRTLPRGSPTAVVSRFMTVKSLSRGFFHCTFQLVA